MLESSKGDDIPQTFLITPKLLPDLIPENADNVTVLFIFNGMFNLNQTELNGNWTRNDLLISSNEDEVEEKDDLIE
jgi:hypothetical protein